MKFDFPAPLAPMSTLSGDSWIVCGSGPNERNPSRLSSASSGGTVADIVGAEGIRK
jgi:hypothetical protein